jgi:hypothetical protein
MFFHLRKETENYSETLVDFNWEYGKLVEIRKNNINHCDFMLLAEIKWRCTSICFMLGVIKYGASFVPFPAFPNGRLTQRNVTTWKLGSFIMAVATYFMGPTEHLVSGRDLQVMRYFTACWILVRSCQHIHNLQACSVDGLQSRSSVGYLCEYRLGMSRVLTTGRSPIRGVLPTV